MSTSPAVVTSHSAQPGPVARSGRSPRQLIIWLVLSLFVGVLLGFSLFGATSVTSLGRPDYVCLDRKLEPAGFDIWTGLPQGVTVTCQGITNVWPLPADLAGR